MAVQCSICLDPARSSEDKWDALHCGHIFHTVCLAQALEYKRACPSCRKEVSRARGRIQLYLQVSDDPASQVAPEHAVDGSAPIPARPGGGGDGAAAAAAELRAQVARRESQLQQERALLQRMKADLLESQELVVGLRAQLSVALAGHVQLEQKVGVKQGELAEAQRTNKHLLNQVRNLEAQVKEGQRQASKLALLADMQLGEEGTAEELRRLAAVGMPAPEWFQAALQQRNEKVAQLSRQRQRDARCMQQLQDELALTQRRLADLQQQQLAAAAANAAAGHGAVQQRQQQHSGAGSQQRQQQQRQQAGVPGAAGRAAGGMRQQWSDAAAAAGEEGDPLLEVDAGLQALLAGARTHRPPLPAAGAAAAGAGSRALPQQQQHQQQQQQQPWDGQAAGYSANRCGPAQQAGQQQQPSRGGVVLEESDEGEIELFSEVDSEEEGMEEQAQAEGRGPAAAGRLAPGSRGAQAASAPPGGGVLMQEGCGSAACSQHPPKQQQQQGAAPSSACGSGAAAAAAASGPQSREDSENDWGLSNRRVHAGIAATAGPSRAGLQAAPGPSFISDPRRATTGAEAQGARFILRGPDGRGGIATAYKSGAGAAGPGGVGPGASGKVQSRLSMQQLQRGVSAPAPGSSGASGSSGGRGPGSAPGGPPGKKAKVGGPLDRFFT